MIFRKEIWHWWSSANEPGVPEGAAKGPARSLIGRLNDAAVLKLGPQDTAQTDQAAQHLLGSVVTQRQILVVADRDCQLTEHLPWLDRHTRGVQAHGTLSDAACAASNCPDETILLVGIDMFLDLNDALDVMIGFRERNPDQVVVIASSFFATHDFSCERAAIADASLRMPVRRPELALALGAAICNHAHLQKRRLPLI